MASQATSQGVSGAAAGAVAGAQMGSVLGPYGWAIGAFVGGVAGIFSGSSADRQFANQQAWQQYNAQMQYQTTLRNMTTSLGISAVNIQAAKRASEISQQQAFAAARYNAQMIAHTTAYNIDLMNQELDRVWEANDLDLEQLEIYRARERGSMVADQSASGTVLGQGSNAAVVMDQRTQEAMDAAIIQHGADIQAADIKNQIAQSRWQGKVAIDQTMWKGEMAAFNARANTQIATQSQALSAMMGASADLMTAKQGYDVGVRSIANDAWAYGEQANQQLISGLFNAGSTAATGYYRSKQPGTGLPSTSSGGGQQGGSVALPSSSYSSPGTSLAVG